MAQAPVVRDSQVRRVYRAEKMVEYMLVNDYAKQTLTKEEVLALADKVLEHPDVRARWGRKTIQFEFLEKTTRKYACATRSSGLIELPVKFANPLWVIHEIAHLLATKSELEGHGPGFAAIQRYLYLHIFGEEACRILDAGYAALGVKVDETQIPPIRFHVPGRNKFEIPGLITGQAAAAAMVLRAARDSGLFDDDEDLAKAATRLARRFDSVEKRIPSTRVAAAPLPKTITLPTSAILQAEDRDDVAEIVLAAMRNHVSGAPMTGKSAPIDPVLSPKKRAAKARRAAKKVAPKKAEIQAASVKVGKIRKKKSKATTTIDSADTTAAATVEPAAPTAAKRRTTRH